MSIKRVGILRGGDTDHYENSLRKGGELILHIHENLADRWKPVDILIDKNGVWHVSGVPVQPVELVNKVDVVWNTAHPSFSLILDSLAIPNIGVESFPFFLSENRKRLEDHMKIIGVRMPRHIVFPVYQKDFDISPDRYILKTAKAVHEKFSPPWVVKSLTEDPNIGIHVANTYPELVDAIEDITNHGKTILAEEFINGKEVSVHSIAGFRGEEIYNLPTIENFSTIEKEKLNAVTRDIYKHLDISNYLNSSFVMHPKRGIFLQKVEFSPDFNKDSHFNRSSKSAGANSKQIIEHILEKALF
jgi:D-alanine-D-alanine ligase-like ATP-grasp enzyme